LRKRERRRLFRFLTCPMCESQVRSGTFVLGADRSQLRLLALSKKFDQLHKKEVLAFREFLVRYPTLGADHPFGRLLAKAINGARRTNLQPGSWYRAARQLDWIAPRSREKTARAGRFNQIGQASWYLGTDARTAAVEVLRRPQAGTQFAVARVDLLESVRVLDLRLPMSLTETNPTRSWILREVIARRYVSEPTDELDESQPQYRLPQYVADLARRRGFRGILYDSTRPSAYNNPEAWGTNLVLFDPLPRRELRAAELMQFGGPDHEIFSAERWPLRTVATTQSTQSCVQIKKWIGGMNHLISPARNPRSAGTYLQQLADFEKRGICRSYPPAPRLLLLCAAALTHAGHFPEAGMSRSSG
jgi:hypothetical protein